MTKFESRFFRALNEQDEEQQAFNQSLDKGTDPNKFNVPPVTPGDNGEVSQHTAAAAEAAARQHAEYVQQIQGWVSKLTEFNEFLNAPTGNSIQSIIANAPEETILKELKSEQSRITRAATEIASLVQKFNSAVTTESSPNFKGR